MDSPRIWPWAVLKAFQGSVPAPFQSQQGSHTTSSLLVPPCLCLCCPLCPGSPFPPPPYLLHVSPFFQICTNSPSPRMPFQAQFCVSGQYWAGQGWGGGAHRSWWSCGGPDISARVKREGRGSCGCPAKGQQASLEGQNRRHHCA